MDDLVEAVEFLGRTSAQGLLSQLVPEPFAIEDIEVAVDAANFGSHPRIAIRFT